MSTHTTNKYRSFGDMLKHLLRDRKLSQSDFARQIGVDRSQISRYINKGMEPYDHTLAVIEEKFSVKITNQGGYWFVVNDDSVASSSRTNDEEVVYAAQADLPESGKLSRDQLKALVEQIESLSKIVRDNL